MRRSTATRRRRAGWISLRLTRATACVPAQRFLKMFSIAIAHRTRLAKTSHNARTGYSSWFDYAASTTRRIRVLTTRLPGAAGVTLPPTTGRLRGAPTACAGACSCSTTFRTRRVATAWSAPPISTTATDNPIALVQRASRPRSAIAATAHGSELTSEGRCRRVRLQLARVGQQIQEVRWRPSLENAADGS